MIVSKEYNDELLIFVDVIRKKIYESVTELNVQFVNISFKIPLTLDFLDKYELTTDFDFVANLTDWNEVEINIHYKGGKLKPEGHYIMTNDWVEPHLLDIFQECIKQDTHTPNIKELEKFNLKRERKHKLKSINKKSGE